MARMSLYGYKRKTRLAPWKVAENEAATRRAKRGGRAIVSENQRRVEAWKNRPKRQKPVARVAAHKVAEQRAYKRRVPHYLRENPVCVACPRMVGLAAVVDGKPHRSESVHHKRGRLGKLLLDERHWLPCCLQSHDWIHANISLARSLDLIAQPGQWNRYEP